MYNFYSTDWHICFYKDMSKLEVQMDLDAPGRARKTRNKSKVLRTISTLDTEGSTKPSTANTENKDPQ